MLIHNYLNIFFRWEFVLSCCSTDPVFKINIITLDINKLNQIINNEYYDSSSNIEVVNYVKILYDTNSLMQF